MIRKVAGLIGLITGAVMFVTLLPNMIDSFEIAFNSSTDIWEQVKAVVSVIWGSFYQPLVLVLLGLIALK